MPHLQRLGWGRLRAAQCQSAGWRGRWQPAVRGQARRCAPAQWIQAAPAQQDSTAARPVDTGSPSTAGQHSRQAVPTAARQGSRLAPGRGAPGAVCLPCDKTGGGKQNKQSRTGRYLGGEHQGRRGQRRQGAPGRAQRPHLQAQAGGSMQRVAGRAQRHLRLPGPGMPSTAAMSPGPPCWLACQSSSHLAQGCWHTKAARTWPTAVTQAPATVQVELPVTKSVHTLWLAGHTTATLQRHTAAAGGGSAGPHYLCMAWPGSA